MTYHSKHTNLFVYLLLLLQCFNFKYEDRIIQVMSTKQFSFRDRIALLSLTLFLFALFSPIVLSQDANSEPIHFAVIGDYGNSVNPFLAQVSAMVHSWQPDFIVTVGDNNYPDGAADTIDANIGQFFHDYIFPYQGSYGDGAESNRFFPAIGNHDYTLDDTLTPYLDYFTLPGNERYYDFVWDPIHFFVVCSDDREPDGNQVDSKQAQWLQEALAASSSTWNVVVLHESPYSSGWHGDKKDVQWPFKEWGADVVLSGHDHDYESIVLDGLPYFVVGAGGDNLREIDGSRSGSRVQYNSSYGAMLVTADSEQMKFDFYGISGKPIAWATTATINDWLKFDLSSTVTEEGTFDFGLTTGSNTSIYFSSKEGANPPELLVKTDEGTYTFTPTDDTYINPEKTDHNYGNKDTLRLRDNNLNDFSTYLRFDVQGISGKIQSAILSLYLTDGEVKGGFSVDSIPEMLNDGSTQWTESNLTAENAPLIHGSDEPIDTFTIQRNS